MTIQVDTREHKDAIKLITKTFDDEGVTYFRSKLPVGDYMSLDNPRLVIDRKQNLLEVCQNVGQGHKRFSSELALAQRLGIKFVLLIEHGYGIKSLDDVRGWANPRCRQYPLAISGDRLFKILTAMSLHYDFEIVFCDKKDTGHKIIEILEAQDG